MAIVAAVMVVAATLFSVTTVMDSVETSLKRGTRRLGADVMVVPKNSEAKAMASLLAGEPSTYYMDRGIEEKIRKIEGVKKVAGQLFLKTSSYKCCDTGDMFIVGFEPEHDFTITPWLSESLKKPLVPREGIMGRAITAYIPGSSFQIYGQLITVVGALEATGMPFIDNALYLPIDSFKGMIETTDNGSVNIFDQINNEISTILVQADPEYAPRRVAIFIESKIDGVKAIVSEDVVATVRKQLFMLLRSILSISVILWIMSILLISVVFSMIVNERQRELGLLRALGAKRIDIFKLIISEAAVLSISGGIIGIGIGGLFLYIFRAPIKAALNVPYMWPQPINLVLLVLICLCLSFLTGTLAALYPAVKSMKMEPYAAIRGGE
ncbi:ABC transporter permease [Candidatus Magnetominusculus xianensis]|nr:ABC transporter permease [Candidatus Magnetominusculus xianensis]MBF0405361.1 ABC transporter permease [Nitrospirota bacterium]